MGIFWTSVVAKMNLTCGGGSSSVFRRALNAGVREHVDFVDDVDLEARPRWGVLDVAADFADVVDAAIAGGVDLEDVDIFAGGDACCSCRTRCRASAVGPFTQLSALARMRAVEVLPTPRAPVKR